MKSIEVAAAVIRRGDKIFATQRGYGDWKDWWEFPGGKLEPGESPQEALKREISEELAAAILVGDLIETVDYDYPAFHLKMHCFWCELDPASPLELLEHEDARWLSKADLRSVRWLPADDAILRLVASAL